MGVNVKAVLGSVAVCGVMLLAGCGGSEGAAPASSAPSGGTMAKGVDVPDAAPAAAPAAASSTSTGDASGSATQVALGTTCLNVAEEDPQCWDGNTWHYSECWNTGPKVELQYWDDSKWVTLAKDFAVEDGCSGNPSWTVATDFSEPDTGETKYRLEFPAQADLDKLTVNFSTTYVR